MRPTFIDHTDDPAPDEDRYARQRLLDWWDQDLLARSRVVVAGAGAIGNEVLKLLALAGVGRIVVVDFDVVSTSNLSRTVLFRAEDVGQPKATLAAERARQINPDIRIAPIQGDIGRDLGLAALARADLVLGGLDSVNARWATNRRCLAAAVPWVNAGITASDVQVTRHVPGDGACYECTFTPAMARRFNERYSCTGLVRRVPDRAVPTTAIAASVVAALQVHDALRFLHDPATGLRPGHRQTLLLDGHRQFVDELPVDPDCPAHVPPVPADDWLTLDHGPDACSASDIAVAAFPDASDTRVRLGFDLVLGFRCPSCGQAEDVGRPAGTVFEDAVHCPSCGGERIVERGAELAPGSPFWSVPLASLGVPPHDLVHVAGPDGTRAVALGGSDPWGGDPA